MSLRDVFLSATSLDAFHEDATDILFGSTCMFSVPRSLSDFSRRPGLFQTHENGTKPRASSETSQYFPLAIDQVVACIKFACCGFAMFPTIYDGTGGKMHRHSAWKSNNTLCPIARNLVYIPRRRARNHVGALRLFPIFRFLNPDSMVSKICSILRGRTWPVLRDMSRI